MLFRTLALVGHEQNRSRAERLLQNYGFDISSIQESIRARSLQILMLTPSHDDTEAAAVALYEKQDNAVHLIVIATAPNFTRHRLCQRLIERLCIDNGNPLYVKTEKFSMSHGIFTRLGFKPCRNDSHTTTSRIDVAGEVSIVLGMNHSNGTLPEAQLEQGIGKEYLETFLANAALHGFQFADQKEIPGRMLSSYLITAFHETSLESLREIVPRLVAKDTAWFRNLAAPEYRRWLSFKLRLLYLSLANEQSFRKHLWRLGLPEQYDALHFAEAVNDQMPTGEGWPKECDSTQDLSCLDLLLLNTLKIETRVQFVPLVRNYGELLKVGFGGDTIPPSRMATMFFYMPDWEAPPTFLFTLPLHLAGEALAIKETIGEDNPYPPKQRKRTRSSLGCYY
ncbi:unnamed protein product [Cylindrotheca closterium]|uniref:Uncharacterized protein n=1 Tax=Cylindrotheca closterium TaxID=2856 RepID=A0AAD2GDV1_9STRA|nr:unnamed protein product [Cylindrotheca closterium]